MDTTNAPLEQALVRLPDGHMMPQLGFGVFLVDPGETQALVADAIRAGYRAIDTARIYENEEGVGAGVRDSGVPEDEIFLTTKLWNEDQGYDKTLAAYDASAKRLGRDTVNLYLIHWPHPRADLYLETWKAFVRLQEERRVTSIGVSNFLPEHLERIIGETGVVPVLNQVELHPKYQQHALRAVHERYGILTESWSPLGHAKILGDETIARIAAKHKRSPAQVILRWHLDQGIITIPKASDRGHMVENLAVGGFSLDEADMAAIATLDDPGSKFGPDPATY